MQSMKIERLSALMKKETLQILRDPSALLITFILPVILIVLFATAVSLDIKQMPIALVQLSHSQYADDLYKSFDSSDYFKVVSVPSVKEANLMFSDEQVEGFVVIPADFSQRLVSQDFDGLVQVITDGSKPNTANFMGNYVKSVVLIWAAQEGFSVTQMPIRSRIWFNASMESRNFLIPGSIGIVMTMIGTLLTALVIAREWERGTMEALLSTPTSISEILLGKLVPYFVLGLIATLMSAILAQFVFQVPFRGSWFALICLSACFMIPALAQGLLISTLAKNQFVASIVALLTAFLPAFLLSGFLFEIDSMPIMIQWLTHILAVKYFVTTIQVIFLTGDVWAVFLPNMGMMLLIGLVLFLIALKSTRKSLE